MPSSVKPSAWTIAADTRAGSLIAASATKPAPSAPAAPRCASSSASRVFPTPPGPVSVRSRTPGSREPPPARCPGGASRPNSSRRRRRQRRRPRPRSPPADRLGRAALSSSEAVLPRAPRPRAPCSSRPGSSPSSSSQDVAERGARAASASAWRPERYSASASCACTALAVRVRDEQGLELRDEPRRLPPSSRSSSMRSSRATTRIPVDPVRVDHRRRRCSGRVGERRAAEQRQPLAEQPGGARPRRPRASPGARGRSAPRSGARSSSLGRDVDRVATGTGHDRMPRAERAPELGDVDLQRLGRRGGRLVAPRPRRSAAPSDTGPRGRAGARRAPPAASARSGRCGPAHRWRGAVRGSRTPSLYRCLTAA